MSNPQIEEIRRTGIAYDREEHTEGICAVGAVIQESAENNMAAISIPVPSQRFYGNEAELGEALLRCCQEIRKGLVHF